LLTVTDCGIFENIVFVEFLICECHYHCLYAVIVEQTDPTTEYRQKQHKLQVFFCPVSFLSCLVFFFAFMCFFAIHFFPLHELWKKSWK